MSSDTKQFGAAFTWIGWIIGIVLLILLFNKILGHEGDFESSIQNQNGAQISELKIKQNRQGHYLLRGQINGQPIIFLVDSGATVTSIPSAVAKKLNLKKGRPFTVETANGTTTAFQTHISELKFGDITLNNVRASIVPGMNGNEALLGMNVLRHFELIQKNRQLIIRQ